jgi:peroxiredoxin
LVLSNDDCWPTCHLSHLVLEGKGMPRVKIDTVAPDFTLADYEGNEVRLSDYRDRQNVLLVFNRGFT